MIKLDQFLFFDALLEKMASKNETTYVLQVGANDGVTFDPIRPFLVKYHAKVKAVLLEPISSHFEKLKKNYQGYSNIIPVQLALHNTAQEMTMYKVDEKKLPELPLHAIGIASFSKTHHQLSGTSPDHVIEEKVRCAPLHEVVSSHSLPRLDVLQIDAEGYDAEIILGLDFQKVRPSVIHFEHGVLQGTMKQSTLDEVAHHLHANGYEIVLEGGDATAYLRSFLIHL